MKKSIFLFSIVFSLSIYSKAQEKSFENNGDFESLTPELLSGKMDSSEFIRRIKLSENDRNNSITDSESQNQTMQAFVTGQIFYVNSSGSGGDGLSWGTAFQDLQSALAAAVSGDQIWVAAGTYKPTTTATRSIAFELKSGVSLYGGFSGSESSVAERDWKSNPTVLSGEIGGSALTDNSDHVIKCASISNIVFDGFIVEKGYASQSYYGGGMYCSGVGNMKIQHCVFRNNSANYHGGGVYILNSAVDIINSEFYDNQTISYDGGGYFATGTQSKKIIGSLFHGNQSGRAGGAIENYNTTLDVVNTTVVDNIANSANGNGLTSWSGTANIYNSIFHENSTTTSNLGRHGGGYIYVYYSLVQSGSYTSGTNVLLGVDPLLVDFSNGNYRLQSGSPCVDAGTSDTTNLHLPDSDLDGQTRLTNNRVDMGAYELGETSPVQAEMDYIFGALDQSYINTGILTDFGIDLADQTLFDGVIRPENIMDMNSWRVLYGSLLTSSINPSSQLIHLKTINQELEDLWETYDKSNPTVDIAVLFAAYQSLRSDAISENLISESNGRLYDVPGRLESPYTTAYAFAAAPNLGYDEDGEVTFNFRSSLFVNSSDKTFSSFQADFGDGAGYQTLTMDTAYTINYSTEGTKTLKFRLQFTDDSVYYSHAEFRVLSVSGGVSTARYSNTGRQDYIFPRLSDPDCPEAFPDPEAWDGRFSGATVTVEYGDPRAFTNPGCDPEFIRPLIVVEGYDPSRFSALGVTNWDYNDFIIRRTNGAIDFDIDLATPGIQSFGDELETAGYDLIFVDLEEGTGDIIRNAYLLENIISWVNAHKINNAAGNREENVVLGQSMGGMIARYAVCDMEKRMLDNPANNPDHEVRLLATHDAPHRGANVPLGFQAQVNELAPMRLTRIGLVTYGAVGAIIGSFIELRDIVPALGQAQQLLNEPASQQMLVVQDGRSNTFLAGVYRNMVTFPAGHTPTFEMIALANGSECGVGQEFVQPGGELFYADANFYVNRLLFTLGIGTVGAAVGVIHPGLSVITFAVLSTLVPFTGKNWKTKYIVRAAPSSGTNQAFYGKIGFQKKILFFFDVNITLFEESRNSQAGALPWDSAPGGYYSLQDVQGRIPANPNINAYPIIDVNLTVRLTEAFNFVSTVSALDIETTPIPSASLSSPFNGGINYEYPSRFDNFISQERDPGEPIGSEHNSRHIQFTPRNAQWLLNEMEGVANNNVNCSADCEQGSFTVTGPSSISCDTEQYVLNELPAGTSVIWSVSSNLQISSGQGTTQISVNLNPGASDGPGWIEATLSTDCGDAPITLDVDVFSDPQPVIPTLVSPSGSIADASDPTNVYFDICVYYGTSTVHIDLQGVQNLEAYNYSGSYYPQVVNTSVYWDFPSTDYSGTLRLEYDVECGHVVQFVMFNNTCYSYAYAVSPNPSDDQLTVEKVHKEPKSDLNLDSQEPVILNVYDKLGEVVLSVKTKNEKATLDIRSLPRGIYHLHVIDRNEIVHVEKIMIAH